MLENIPKGIWRWVETSMKDLGRIADALETIAREATEMRKALQEESNDRKEQPS